jgi:hypothetical protein
MILKVNSDGLLFVPYVNVNEAVVAGKERGIGLVPGWNEIPQEDWPNAAPHLVTHIANGKIELRGKEIEESYVDDVTGETKKRTVVKDLLLGEIRADIARKVVEGCFNPKDLNRWREDAKLTSELRAIADIQWKKIEELDKV